MKNNFHTDTFGGERRDAFVRGDGARSVRKIARKKERYNVAANIRLGASFGNGKGGICGAALRPQDRSDRARRVRKKA